MKIRFQGVSLIFTSPRANVLDEVTFQINSGERVALIGQSGSGKSTIIKLLASYLTPTSGSININDSIVVRGHPSSHLGYVSQSAQTMFFPWWTVERNILYPLIARGALSKLNRGYCYELIRSLKLEHRLKAYPYQLSGGEQKRLSLAMVLSYKPRLLLLDEPFAGLDLKITGELWDLLHRIFETEKPTVLFVTHSFDEAALLTERAIFLTEMRGVLVDSKTASDYTIPQSYPRFKLINDPSVVAYKQHLLTRFTGA